MKIYPLLLLIALFLFSHWVVLAETPNEAHISIKQLEARISTLEDLLQDLQQKQSNANLVTAPFKVVDKQGNVLMQINNNGTFTSLILNSQEKENSVVMATGAYGSRLMLVDGSNSALVEAHEDGSHITVANADVKAFLGSGEDGRDGLVIQTPGIAPAAQENTGGNQGAGGGQMSAEISTQTGKKLALRLSDDQGKIVVSAGSNPAAAGSGTVKVANTKGENVAFMGATLEGEHGVVGVAKGGKDVIALLAEPRLVAVYNDTGAPIVSMGKSDKSDAGNLTARDSAGDGVFSAGYNSAVGGGDACVYRAKRQNKFCLGIGLPGMMGTMGN